MASFAFPPLRLALKGEYEIQNVDNEDNDIGLLHVASQKKNFGHAKKFYLVVKITI